MSTMTEEQDGDLDKHVCRRIVHALTVEQRVEDLEVRLETLEDILIDSDLVTRHEAKAGGKGYK